VLPDALPISSEEIPKSLREIPESVKEICISPGDLGISLSDLGISLSDLGISLSDLGISSEEIGISFIPTTQPKVGFPILVEEKEKNPKRERGPIKRFSRNWRQSRRCGPRLRFGFFLAP